VNMQGISLAVGGMGGINPAAADEETPLPESNTRLTEAAVDATGPLQSYPEWVLSGPRYQT